ncbi:ATP-binding protein [Streptomyces sp. K1PN6]|uniref:ATP-binding protein n=1 Tax=Streptomyces acidicola TaxID=2596892 RepID=A0A5N8WSW6_9ACTN|nr:ATP-binding protein [Streptomyces acidicola]
MSEPPAPQPNDSWEYRLTLPHHAIGSGVARSTLRSILTRHSLPDLADTAELLTSELCGNSYRYATGPATVRVRWRDGTLHVGVRDGNDVLPSPRSGGTGVEGGRGLLLVSHCAQAWGSQAAPGGAGKVTWFELRG